MTPFVTPSDPLYPEALRHLFDPPARLYYRGNLEVLRRPCLALVGTRDSTNYGNKIAFEFAQELARHGACIVSGLAFGVDAQAHRGALVGAGPTVAVLAQALEELQPSSHRGLAQEIVERGGLLLSEYPPGTPPFKSHYLVRNRIIAGLCKATVVVEAGVRSGALNTAKHALEMNRDIFCVPGRIGDSKSAGCLTLLAQGEAGIVTHVQELIATLELQRLPALNRALQLSGFALELYTLLHKKPCGIGLLSETFSERLPEFYSTLAELELQGFLHLTPQGIYSTAGGSTGEDAEGGSGGVSPSTGFIIRSSER